MSPAMDYKGATGVRARSDLSPNARAGVVDPHAPLTPPQLLRASQFLIGLTRMAESHGHSHVSIPLQGAYRLADALLSAAQPPVTL